MNEKKYYPNKSKQVFIDRLSTSDYGMYNDEPFTGIIETISPEEYIRETFVNRKLHGVVFNISEEFFSIIVYIYNQSRYTFHIYKNSSKTFPDKLYTVYDLDTLDLIMDYKILDDTSKRLHYEGYSFTREDLDYDKKIKDNSDVVKNYEDTKDVFTRLDLFVHTYWDNPFNLTKELNRERAGKTLYGYLVQESMKETLGYTVPDDFMEKYVLQNELAEKIVEQDDIPDSIKYIGGISVAYNDIDQKMVSAIVVMNIETQEIVDQAFYESEDVTLHIPDLFAYNEVPVVLKAFEKLNIKPHLIFCDGHGIEHPKNMGLATHLGIELNIPTIGCPKKRLVGYYDKATLGNSRGDTQELLFDDKIVGKALRTLENNNPLYVSIGHKISLETAVNWVLKMTINTRVPFIVQEAINITEQLMPKRIRYDFLDDEENQYGIII
ncbi:endonuclease V [Flavobacterium sp. LS1R47]|uniref:Endonuclease V n=1 Tax=Flavobacterium frigoritolerans TaxID=2987686 RepID=A0A9X2ZIS6_9FLAO|nr:endonuclease V [Flavobacterium frigoritolerans]MCV9931839.1 endonuclease V [Flavobacterium frigoritolerans]